MSIGFSFTFTNRTYAGIDMESRMKNASQVGPHIRVAFQFSTSCFIYTILIFPSFFSTQEMDMDMDMHVEWQA